MNHHPLNFIRTRYRTLCLGCLLGQMAFGQAQASDATWIASSNGPWGTGSNWSPASSPGSVGTTTSTDTATFNNATGVTVTVDTNRNIKNITFDGAAGAYTLSGGSLILTNGGALSLTAAATTSTNETVSSPITLAGNYTFQNNAASASGILRASGTITGVASGSSTLTLDGTNTGSNLVSGVIANGAGGTTSLVKTGTGTWLLQAANTLSGGVTVKGGTLRFNTTGSAANSAITVGQAGTNISTSLVVTSSAASTTIGSSLTYNGSFNSGGGNFNVTGLTSPANSVNSFGALTLAAGEMNGIVTTSGKGNIQMVFSSVTRNAGTQLVFNGSTSNVGTSTIASATAATSNVVFTAAPTLTGGGGSAGTTSVSVLPWAFVANNLATYDSTYGLRALTAAEEATLTTGLNPTINATTSTVTLSSNSSVNALRITGGTVTFGTNGTSLTVGSGAVAVSSNATLGSSAGNGVLAFGSAEGLINVATTRTLTVNSVITGTGGLTIGLEAGAGTSVVLAAANTHSGVTTFEGNNTASQVYLTNSLALQNSTLDYNNYGASFTFGNNTGTGGQTSYAFGGLKGAQNITLANNNTSVQAVTLTVGSNGDNTTYSGVLSDGTAAGGALTKTGSGTLTLTGANTYSGGTSISGGKLQVNNLTGSGTGTGAVGVHTGATLAGGGTISGNTTLDNGSFLAPGSASGTIGTLAISGNLTLNNSGANSLVFDLGAGNTSDRVTVGTTLTFNSQNFVSFAFNTSGVGVTDPTGTYLLFTSANNILGGGTFGTMSSTTLFSGYNSTLSIDGTGKNFVLTVAVVPEPGTWALMFGGLAALIVWQRRKGNLS